MRIPDVLSLLFAAMFATTVCAASEGAEASRPPEAMRSDTKDSMSDAKEAAESMAEQTKTVASRSTDLIGDLTQRAALTILRLAKKPMLRLSEPPPAGGSR